ncbi:hypothetical protein FNW02_00750 [Komarekiella sp. 'clone 1']|uniref:Uncharacterized protein n=1 Tax=Komarekiella delphini-convector SJRDD-AB1 TaxID=2593771 RepID=A0AA40SSX0_9NOST|nr:hypothetical protein [Komarekiella delphini-convector]MBD6614439.1 hypothetical protein [Komarekiella delphini-convector SJRDD-AB1]
MLIHDVYFCYAVARMIILHQGSNLEVTKQFKIKNGIVFQAIASSILAAVFALLCMSYPLSIIEIYNNDE